MLLIDSLEKYGENWEEIVKVFQGKRSKQECLLHLIQLPIKDNIIFKLSDSKAQLSSTQQSNQPFSTSTILNAVNDQNNPIISQVVFFAKMFEKFVQEDLKGKQEEAVLTEEPVKKDFSSADELKEVIYKTYAKSIDKSRELRQKEKQKMEKIMNLLVYLQMKKIEMKLNYFNDFEKLIQFETQQMKSMESQIIQDRIKLAIKKSEIIGMSDKIKKEARESHSESNGNIVNNGNNHLPLHHSSTNGHAGENIISLPKSNLEAEPRYLDLNH